MIDLEEVLRTARTIAVVGCSARPGRTSHGISRYLKEQGYRMIPVNPHHDEVHGEPCYPDLQQIPGDVQVDLVNVFRNPRYTDGVVEMAIARAEAQGTRPVIWTQIGVSSAEAERRATEAGLPYVRNRCILVEHARLLG